MTETIKELQEQHKGEDATYICKEYSPDTCRFQCKLLVSPWTFMPPWSCVDGGGNCEWELVVDESKTKT